jgi:hypothetical protein
MYARTFGSWCALAGGGLAVALALSGCTTSQGSSTANPVVSESKSAAAANSLAPGNASSSARGSGHVPTTAELRAALLTAGDLPAGYTAQPVSGSGLSDSSLSGCPALVSDPTGVSASAGVNLTDAATGSSVSETLLQMRAAGAAKAFAVFAAISANCRSFSGELAGYKVTFAAAPLPVTALGDQTTASRLTGKVSTLGASIYVDFIVVRHASTLIVLSVVGLTADTAFTRQMASAAYNAVAARW